jgi:ABC-type multidrug transport system fused ATPase/permease subunit
MPAPAARQQGSEAIRFENVTLAFDDKVVLDDISFRLPLGET